MEGDYPNKSRASYNTRERIYESFSFSLVGPILAFFVKNLAMRFFEAVVASLLLDGELEIVFFAFFFSEFGVAPTVSRATRFLPFFDLEAQPEEALEEFSVVSEGCFSNSSNCWIWYHTSHTKETRYYESTKFDAAIVTTSLTPPILLLTRSWSPNSSKTSLFTSQ